MSKLYVLNGSDIGRVFTLKEGISYLGQASDNDITISDGTVSHRHLRIIRMSDKISITDMKSRNGTFYNGRYLVPEIEIEVRQGIPIATGVTMICIGEGCIEQIMPSQEFRNTAKKLTNATVAPAERRRRPNQRNLQFLNNVCDVLMDTTSVREAARKVLDHIFALLQRIDRAGFILIDVETKSIKEIVFKSRKPNDDFDTSFCRDVVNEVLKERKPLVISDVQSEEGSAIVDTLKILKIHSVMCVPLISGPQVMGTLYVDSLKRPYGFRREDCSLLMDLSQRVAMVIEYAMHAFQLHEGAED